MSYKARQLGSHHIAVLAIVVAIFSITAFQGSQLAVNELTWQIRAIEKDGIIEAGRFSIADSVLQFGPVDLQGGDSTRELPISQVRSVVRIPKAAAGDRRPNIVSLRDGSVLYADSVETTQDAIRIQAGAETSIKVPLASVRSIQLSALNETQQKQWEAIVQATTDQDALVVIRSPESLDSVKGVVESIKPEIVELNFNGQTIPAPKNRLAGVLIYAPPSESEAPKAILQIKMVGGDKLQVAEITVGSNEVANILLVAGGTIELPLDQISELDFSIGSLRELAELKPFELGAQPRLSFLNTIDGADRMFEPRFVNSDLVFLGAGFSTFVVPEGFKQFVGEVKLAPKGDRFSPCKVEVLVEKTVVWQSDLTEVGVKQAFNVPIEPEQRLELRVKYKDDLPIGDVVLWLNPRLLR